jgi:hypothetical protein
VTNSSQEWWSLSNLDGTEEVSLHQWGWSVTTVGGSRYDLPPRRGTDITLAYRPGVVHRRKVPDARQISLSMFMVGWDPATGNANDDMLTQWNDNWDLLRRKVFRNFLLQDQRVRLIRRWFLTAPEFPTIRNGDICVQGDPGVPVAGKRLVTAFTNAEMTGQMQPTMTGRYRAEFTMDFTLPEPYFYGNTTVSATLIPNTPVWVWNDGHDAAAPGYIQVDLYGPLINPAITNLSTNPDSWVRYMGTIPAGQQIRLTINRFSCEQIVSSGTNINKIANISNYGARFWVNVLPGTNKFELLSAGTGHAVLSFRPPYV